MKAIFAILLVCVLSVQASLRPQFAASELFGAEELALLANLPTDVQILKGLYAHWRSVNLVNGANLIDAIKATFNASQSLIAQLDILTHSWISRHLNSSKVLLAEEEVIAIVNALYEIFPEVLAFKTVGEQWRHVNFISGENFKDAVFSTLNNISVILNQVDEVAHHKISNLLAKHHISIAQLEHVPQVELFLTVCEFLYNSPAQNGLNTIQSFIAAEQKVAHGDFVGALNNFTTIANFWKRSFSAQPVISA